MSTDYLCLELSLKHLCESFVKAYDYCLGKAFLPWGYVFRPEYSLLIQIKLKVCCVVHLESFLGSE